VSDRLLSEAHRLVAQNRMSTVLHDELKGLENKAQGRLKVHVSPPGFRLGVSPFSSLRSIAVRPQQGP